MLTSSKEVSSASDRLSFSVTVINNFLVTPKLSKTKVCVELYRMMQLPTDRKSSTEYHFTVILELNGCLKSFAVFESIYHRIGNLTCNV